MILFGTRAIFTLILLLDALGSDNTRKSLITGIDNRFEQNHEIALNIWNLAELVKQARAELDETHDRGFKYVPLPGNRAPALGYRAIVQ